MVCLIIESYWTSRKRVYKFEDFDKAWRVYRRINKNRFQVTFVRAA